MSYNYPKWNEFMDIVFWWQRAARTRDVIRNMSVKWGENVSGIFMAMAREFLLASHPQTSLSDSSRRRETCGERRQDVKNKTWVLERKRGRHGGSANRGVRLKPRSIIDLWPAYFSITQHTHAASDALICCDVTSVLWKYKNSWHAGPVNHRGNQASSTSRSCWIKGL